MMKFGRISLTFNKPLQSFRPGLALFCRHFKQFNKFIKLIKFLNPLFLIVYTAS